MVDVVGAADWEDWDFPPPPPPPLCNPSGATDLYCHLVEGGAVGARFNGASFPTLPIVAVCSSVVLVALLVAGFLLWRHKSKAPNLLPCKPEPQPPEMLGAANGVTYEDAFVSRHPTRIPQGHTLMPLEILDIKLGDSPIPHLHRAPCYQSRQDHPYHHPVYEDINNHHNKSTKSKPPTTSDDDFPISGQCSATSSVRGSTGGDLCRDAPSSDDDDGIVSPGDPPYPYPGHPMQYPPVHSSWRPAESPYQENIYATIDEDESMVDYPVQQRPPPSLPSLARPKTASKHRSRTNKSDDNGSSYGDMMPNFHHRHQQSAFM